MKAEIMIFRGSAPVYQPFENTEVYKPLKTRNRMSYLPTMSSRQITDMLRSELSGICQDSITNDYIRVGIKKAHYFFVAFDHAKQEICGLLLLHVYRTWSPKFKDHLFGYVDLVCSRCKSFGKRLMASAENFCRDLNCLFMRINSVPEQIGFYTALGYEHKVQPCDPTSVARPMTYVRNRSRNRSNNLKFNDIGAKMTKCL